MPDNCTEPGADLKWRAAQGEKPAGEGRTMTFMLYADKNKLVVRKRGSVTSGSANVYPVRFEFSGDWTGLKRTAVFQAGGEAVSMLLDESGACCIPREVMTAYGVRLRAGVYGTLGEDIVLPTVWADLGEILQGVTMPDGGTYPPTPELWEQALSGKGDALRYDGLNLSLLSGEQTLSSVEVAGGGESIVYNFGHGLKQNGLDVSVDAVSDFTGDNTLPMSAAGVQTVVGNIEILLETI